MKIKEINIPVISYEFGEPCCKELQAYVHAGSIRTETIAEHGTGKKVWSVVFMKSKINFCPFCGEKFEEQSDD
jgi:hypothetical protein